MGERKNARPKGALNERADWNNLRARRVAARRRPASPGAHLPEHHVEVRHERAYGAPVRFGGVRLLLHAPGEPHQRCRGGEDRGVGRRMCGHAHLLGPGGELLRGVQHRGRRRSCGGLLGHLRRHLQPARPHHGPHGAGMHVRGPALHRRGTGSRLPPQHEVRLRRNHRESGALGARHRALRGGGPRPRRAARRGQHLPHAGAAAAPSNGAPTS